MDIPARIRRVREGVGLTQSAAAQRAGISRLSWHRIENNLADPFVGTLERIARALGLSLTELLSPEDDATDDERGVA